MNTIKGKHAEVGLYLQLAGVGGSRSKKIRINPELTKIGIFTTIHNLVNDCHKPESLLWVKLLIIVHKETYTITLRQNLPKVEQGAEIIKFTNYLPFPD